MNSTANLCLLALVVVLVSSMQWTEGSRSDVINELSYLIEEEQMTSTSPYGGLGKNAQVEGLYNYEVRVNFRGKCEQYMLRKYGRLPDYSSFLTGYIGSLILDAYQFGKAPLPSHKSLERIAKVYRKYHNYDKPFNNSIVSFYTQLFEKEHDASSKKPVDMFEVLQGLPGTNASAEKNVEFLFGDYMPPGFTGFLTAYALREDGVPPDFDSISVHLAFGARLYLNREYFPEAWDIWNKDNPNITSIFDTAKHYAYRPFSDDPDASTTNPRVYYTLRKFLDEAKNQGRDLVLLNTWVRKIGNQNNKNPIMPFVVNDVVVGVLVNFFTGVISSVTNGMVDPELINDDSELNVLIESCADLVVFVLEDNFGGRFDVSETNYHSLIGLYWFVARNLMLLENAKINGPLSVPAFERYYEKLAQVMRGEVTDRILELRIIGDNGDIYYEEELGNADMSYYDQPIERHEDRVFTTSAAANGLMSIWTVHDEVNGLRWVAGTPDTVKETVHGCADWLEENILTGEYALDTLFTGYDLYFDSLPYWYPANRFEHLNGTKIDGFTFMPPEPVVFGVQGYVEPEDYEEMLKVAQFDTPIPKFEGYNKGRGNLPFITSNAFTYATVMLTLSMTEQLD